jgi:hypothetical protein
MGHIPHEGEMCKGERVTTLWWHCFTLSQARLETTPPRHHSIAQANVACGICSLQTQTSTRSLTFLLWEDMKEAKNCFHPVPCKSHWDTDYTKGDPRFTVRPQQPKVGAPSTPQATWMFPLRVSIFNQQKPLFLPIMAYTLSTTKLEIRAK